MKMPSLRLIFPLLVILFISGNAFSHTQTTEVGQEKIRELIAKTFDQPNLKVQTTPIVIVGKIAIADWVQGPKGGRALLRRKHDEWEIIACGGAGFKDAHTIASAGISKEIADKIANQLATAEAKLSPQKIKQLDSFDGVVTMRHNTHHGSQEKH
jgi:hypothetical protein